MPVSRCTSCTFFTANGHMANTHTYTCMYVHSFVSVLTTLTYVTVFWLPPHRVSTGFSFSGQCLPALPACLPVCLSVCVCLNPNGVKSKEECNEMESAKLVGSSDSCPFHHHGQRLRQMCHQFHQIYSIKEMRNALELEQSSG